jgi:hypothetical protein
MSMWESWVRVPGGLCHVTGVQVHPKQATAKCSHSRHLLLHAGEAVSRGVLPAEAVLLQVADVPRLHGVVVEAVPPAGAGVPALRIWLPLLQISGLKV